MDVRVVVDGAVTDAIGDVWNLGALQTKRQLGSIIQPVPGELECLIVLPCVDEVCCIPCGELH